MTRNRNLQYQIKSFHSVPLEIVTLVNISNFALWELNKTEKY